MTITADNLAQAIRKVRAPGQTMVTELAELRAIVVALDEWAGDGLRTGQQLDRIIDAARDYVEAYQ